MPIFENILNINNPGLIYAVLFAAVFIETLAFIGYALPGTTLFIFTGYICSQGVIRLEYAVILITLAGAAGSTVSFYLGEYGGNWVKGRRIFNEDRLRRAEVFFDKHGQWSVLLAHFIGPLRPMIPFVAGLFRTSRNKFLVVNTLSSFGAAIFFVPIGYFFGQESFALYEFVQRYDALFAALALVAVAAFLLWKMGKQTRG